MTDEYELSEKRLREFHQGKHDSTYTVWNRSGTFMTNTAGNNTLSVLLAKLFRSANLIVLKDGRSFLDIIHTVENRPINVPDFVFFLNQKEKNMWDIISPCGNILHTFDLGANEEKYAILHKDLMLYKKDLALGYPHPDHLSQTPRYIIPAGKKLNILDPLEEVVYNKNYKHIKRTFPSKF